MALIDVFLKSRRAQKILFLADRDSLVDQAMTKGFKEHIPAESWELIRTYLSHDPKEVSKRRGASHIINQRSIDFAKTVALPSAPLFPNKELLSAKLQHEMKETCSWPRHDY